MIHEVTRLCVLKLDFGVLPNRSAHLTDLKKKPPKSTHLLKWVEISTLIKNMHLGRYYEHQWLFIWSIYEYMNVYPENIDTKDTTEALTISPGRKDECISTLSISVALTSCCLFIRRKKNEKLRIGDLCVRKDFFWT